MGGTAPAGRLAYGLLLHRAAGGARITNVYVAGKVLTLPYFLRISQEDYKVLLTHLLDTDHLQRTEKNGLIIGAH